MNKVVGIDLGTTNSVVAAIEGGQPTVITNAEGFRTTPSIVAYTKKEELLVGQLAKRQSVVNAENTFFSVKRFIGCKADEVSEESKELPYKVVKDDNGNIKIKCSSLSKDFSPEEVSAQVIRKLIADAKLLEESGCFAIVFEKIPAHLAKQVSEAISIPTIGIGAGQDCDGQVLVLHDMLGITTDFSPRFLRRYLDLENQITGAVQQYCEDVRSGDFPNEEESY